MFTSNKKSLNETPSSIKNSSVKPKSLSFVKNSTLLLPASTLASALIPTTPLNRPDFQPYVRLEQISNENLVAPAVPFVPQPPQQEEVVDNAVLDDSDSENEMTDHSSPLLASFTGSSSQNAADWLTSLNEYCTYKQFNAAKRLSFFKLKLTEIAKVWLLALPANVIDTYEHLSNAFLERFQPREAERHKLVRDLFAIKQLPDETVDAYLSKLLRRAQLCGVDNAMTIHAAIGGLRPEVSNFCLERNPQTFEDLITAARLGEMTRPNPTLFNGTFNVQIESLTDQVSKMNEQMTKMASASINPSPPQHIQQQRFTTQQHPPRTYNAQNNQQPQFRNTRPQFQSGFGGNRNGQFNASRPSGAYRPSFYDQSRRPTQPSMANGCARCGRQRDHPNGMNCPMSNQTCFRCSKVGHSYRVCRSQSVPQYRNNY